MGVARQKIFQAQARRYRPPLSVIPRSAPADCSDLAIQIQNSKTKIYIASFQVAQLHSHLKGDYVNFGFAVLDFMLQDYCNQLHTILLLQEIAVAPAKKLTAFLIWT